MTKKEKLEIAEFIFDIITNYCYDSNEDYDDFLMKILINIRKEINEDN